MVCSLNFQHYSGFHCDYQCHILIVNALRDRFCFYFHWGFQPPPLTHTHQTPYGDRWVCQFICQRFDPERLRDVSKRYSHSKNCARGYQSFICILAGCGIPPLYDNLFTLQLTQFQYLVLMILHLSRQLMVLIWFRQACLHQL